MATVERGVGGVSFALTAEQRELRALAREFAEKEIRPRAAECDEHQTHATDIIAEAHAIGLMNLHLPESLGWARAFVLRRDHRRRGAELGLLRDRHLDWCERARGRPDPDRRVRGAEDPVARSARRGPDPRVLRPDGAGGRVGCRGNPDHGGAQGRRLCDQRIEDVHLERRPCLLDGVLRLDRP